MRKPLVSYLSKSLTVLAAALFMGEAALAANGIQVAQAPAAGDMAQRANRVFGVRLDCSVKRRDSTAAIAQAKYSPAEVAAALSWAEVELRRVGYEAARPKDAGAGYIAALARSGNLVAAKMANDDLVHSSKTYGTSPWASSIEAFLTIQTQPVNHASYPTAVKAEGEAPEPAGAHHHGYGVDLEDTSAALREIIGRAALAKRALGPTFGKVAVRYYQLAQGFRDEIALEASAARVCQLKLPAGEQHKVDISARMMAMPTRAEAGGTQ